MMHAKHYKVQKDVRNLIDEIYSWMDRLYEEEPTKNQTIVDTKLNETQLKILADFNKRNICQKN